MNERERRKRILRMKADIARVNAAGYDMAAAALDASDAVSRLTHVFREGQENDFMELWVRFDDPLDPEPRPWKANKHRYVH